MADDTRGGTYHVMNRGNRKALIFEDDRDRLRFLGILKQVQTECQVLVLAICLMGNHFHILLVTPEGNLSEFMRELEGRYARYSNWRHQRVGHLFQDRYKRVIIENDLHLLTAACYVFMNPVTAGLTKQLAGWKWSTYAATVGLTVAPSYLSLGWVDTLFPAGERSDSQRLFRQLMGEAKPVLAYANGDQSYSVDSTRQVIRSFIGERHYDAKLPTLYRSAFRPKLEELLPPNLERKDRLRAIDRAHVIHGYRLAEIARVLGVHPDTVGRWYRACRLRSESGPDPDSDRDSRRNR